MAQLKIQKPSQNLLEDLFPISPKKRPTGKKRTTESMRSMKSMKSMKSLKKGRRSQEK